VLSSKYRFHSRGGVRYTLSRGKSIRTDKLTIISNINTRGGQRFAVVVSKKIFKSAVARNRIRRRVYEAIRNNFTQAAIDQVFIVNSREVKDMSFAELEFDIRELMTKAAKSAKIKRTE